VVIPRPSALTLYHFELRGCLVIHEVRRQVGKEVELCSIIKHMASTESTGLSTSAITKDSGS